MDRGQGGDGSDRIVEGVARPGLLWSASFSRHPFATAMRGGVPQSKTDRSGVSSGFAEEKSRWSHV